MSERVTVAEAIGRTLAQLGAAPVFGVVGSGNFHVTNAMTAAGVPFIAARHEMGAACMADAHARLTGRPAILSLHQGCGLTNALTGIAESAKCHTPLLVVTGDTVNGDETSNFYIDQDASVAAVGAVPLRIHSAESAVHDTIDAYQTATMTRATVVLSMPVDIQREEIEVSALDEGPVSRHLPAGAAPAAVDELVAALGKARRPLIVAGRGAWNAGEELKRLARVAGALLVTTAGARGLFVDDEWALDIMGGFSTEGAAELIRDADVIVAFGAGLNSYTTREGSLLRGSKLIQVDDRQRAIGFHAPIDVGVVGDAAIVASATADAMEKRYPGRVGYRTDDVHERVNSSRHWKDQPFTPRREPGRVDPQELINRLDELLPDERVVVPDGGNVNCYPGAHLRVPDQRGYCMPLAFQAIGLGLAAGIGAGVAQPDRMPIVGTGDGAFLMTLVELDTAVRLGLRMVIIVFNDDAYGAEVNLFRGETNDLDIVRFPDTDIAAIARGYGCQGVTIRALADVDQVEKWLSESHDRPLVIDAKIAKFPSWMMARRHSVQVAAEAEVSV